MITFKWGLGNRSEGRETDTSYSRWPTPPTDRRAHQEEPPGRLTTKVLPMLVSFRIAGRCPSDEGSVSGTARDSVLHTLITTSFTAIPRRRSAAWTQPQMCVYWIGISKSGKVGIIARHSGEAARFRAAVSAVMWRRIPWF